jgi:hypothetical protein
MVLAASIIRAMEAASISETSVNFYQVTRRNIQEDSHLPVMCSSGSVKVMEFIVQLSDYQLLKKDCACWS